jgi:hypothetical protein
MDAGLIGTSAFSNNPSLLALLFGSSSAPVDPMAGLLNGPNPDPFASVIALSLEEPLQTQNLAANLTAGHSILSAAEPLLAGSLFSPGTAGGGSPDAVAQNVSRLAEALNRALQGNGSSLSSALSGLSGLLQSQSAALAGIGITTDSTGTLAVDTVKLSAAIQNAPQTVQSLLQGPSGLAQVASNGARSLINQTLGVFGVIPGAQGSALSNPGLGLLLNLQA